MMGGERWLKEEDRGGKKAGSGAAEEQNEAELHLIQRVEPPQPPFVSLNTVQLTYLVQV